MVIRGFVGWVLLISLLGACDLQPPDASAPSDTAPGTTLAAVTTPDVTEPPATTPVETAPDVTEPPATTPVETAPETESEVTTPAETEDGEGAAEEGETFPWIWIVLGGAVVALFVAALTRRSASRSAEAAWQERARSALTGVASIEATLGRPATLNPSEQEAVRRSIASARDQSMSFEQLAASAPDQALAQQAAATADALRVLATSSEIEIEGLASGALTTLADREAAEAERRVHLQTLHQAADRLSQSLQ